MLPRNLSGSRAVALAGAAAIFWNSVAIGQVAPGPNNRTEAVAIIKGLRTIVAPDGIERREKVRIGGIDQWVSVRGRDLRNPVLLFLHGGPGFVSMPTSWYGNQGWDEYFTVIQWDQRGAGKTYVANDPAKVAPTMTVPQMIADTEEMVQWARRTFKKDRIVLAGASWGSMLGLEVAHRHPEWLSAYIGMSQMTNGLASERDGWRWAMERAKATGNAQAVKELASIAPYAESLPPRASIGIQRRWLQRFGGEKYGHFNLDTEVAAINLSPDYSDAEVAQIWNGNEFSEKYLLDKALTINLNRIRELKVPIVIMAGRADHVVSGTVAEQWLARLKAPSKKFVWFEQSGHDMYIDEPGKTLVTLVSGVLPLARSK